MKPERVPAMYIDKATFLQHMRDYVASRELAKVEGRDPPQIPDVIGRAFIQIATRMATRYNFNGYTYRDEMVSDGILNSVEAVDSFDPENPAANPFGYFSRVIFWAFLRRIEKEKKERKTRDDLMLSSDYESFVTQEGDEFAINQDELLLFYNQ